jgi:hypothetical protein
VIVETIERCGPEAPVRLQPGIELAERPWDEPVEALLPIDSGNDHAGLSEDAEVLRDARLAQAEVGDEVPDGCLSVAEDAQDLAAVRLGEDGERDRHAGT